MSSRLLRLSRAATLLTLVMLAWYADLPLALPVSPLTPTVHLGEITALLAIGAYALAGWPNLAALRGGWRQLFGLALLGFVAFAALSLTWSPQRGLAAMRLIHLIVWVAFALFLMCAAWPPSAMAFAFLGGLLLHSLAGLIEISWLPLIQSTAQNSGISVVFNGEQHLLRIPGLSPHPNILGGHLAVGVILTAGLSLTTQARTRRWLIAAWLIIWITLLLTFSRSAWLGVIGGSAAALLLLWRGHHLTRSRLKPIVLFSGLGLLAVSIFSISFKPFLVNRIEVTAVAYEAQSITERLSLINFAGQIFAAHPLTGVGLAQSGDVLRELGSGPIAWIHNVPLLIASELGVGGSVLIGLAVIAVFAIGGQRWQTRSITLWSALVGGSLIALAIVMQFDHYLWTMSQGGLLSAWLLGWWLGVDQTTAS